MATSIRIAILVILAQINAIKGVSNNSLENVPSGTTEDINLTTNSTVLKNTCSPSCFCEENESYASCMGNETEDIPVFPSTLHRLELRKYNLTNITTLQVHGKQLKELQLQQCNITYLGDEVFSALVILNHLDLAHNNIQNLEAVNFRGLPAVKYLDLSFNSIDNLNHPFKYLNQLENLNLQNNKLSKLGPDAFQGLEKVQYLNLDHNKIQTIDVASFQHLGNLAHLILSNNLLFNLTRLNFFGSRLQYIDVSNIGIDRVPQALTQLVRDLRLAGNNIREIHRGDFDSYPYIGLLVLDNNGLEVLEEDVLGRHEYLSRLWLNTNQLQTVPQSLPTSLRALHLEANNITRLQHDDFRGLHRLEQLFLKGNRITSISLCSLCDLVGLKSLDLQSNEIQSISDPIFAKLDALEQLDLSQNPIKSLGAKVFLGLCNLRTLQLSRISTNVSLVSSIFQPLISLEALDMYCSPSLTQTLIQAPLILESLSGLRELNLMHNELQSIRNDFPTFFPNMSVIKLSGNSWDCTDDRVLWMKNWTRISSISFYRYFSVRCSKPPELNLHPVLLLEYSNFPRSTQSPSPISTLAVTTSPTQKTSTVEQKRVLARPYLHKGIIVPSNSSNLTRVLLKKQSSIIHLSTTQPFERAIFPSRINHSSTHDYTFNSLPKRSDRQITQKTNSQHKYVRPAPLWQVSSVKPELATNLSVVRKPTGNETLIESKPTSHNTRDLWIYRGENALKKSDGIQPTNHVTYDDGFLAVCGGILIAWVVTGLIIAGYFVAKRASRSVFIDLNARSQEQYLIASAEETPDNITETHRGLNNRLYYLLQKSPKCQTTSASAGDASELQNELFSVCSLTEPQS